MLRGFKNFLMRGDVIIVAVGLVIALAFSMLVTAFTTDIINPFVAAAQGRGQSRCSCILNCCYVAGWTFRGACGMRDGWLMRGLS